MTDIREYELLAVESGAYRDIELNILHDTLSSWTQRPGAPYSVVELRDGKTLAGFAVFSKLPGSDFTYEVQAILVERIYRREAVGARLLEILEEEVRRLEANAVLRFELSHRKLEVLGPEILPQAGYILIGHIPEFYEPGDDYYIYAKHLLERKSEPAQAATAAPEAEEPPPTSPPEGSAP